MSEARKMLAMAQEWARELGKYKGHELLVAEVAGWGFQEVNRGRHPDTVLKEVLAKIEDGIGPVVDHLAPASEPDAGNDNQKRVDPKSS